jgi:hypothetical protein
VDAEFRDLTQSIVDPSRGDAGGDDLAVRTVLHKIDLHLRRAIRDLADFSHSDYDKTSHDVNILEGIRLEPDYYIRIDISLNAAFKTDKSMFALTHPALPWYLYRIALRRACRS